MTSTTLLTNPLREGLQVERSADPCLVVIFGATGDLTKRKLIPALFSLAENQLLPSSFGVVGFSRKSWTDDQFRQSQREFIGEDRLKTPVWKSFEEGMFYCSSDFSDPAGYKKLGEMLDRIDRERGTQNNRLFYLSTPPEAYSEIIRQLGAARLVAGSGSKNWTRIIIEKPFGRDLV
ncbi:MAG: glucose-6-phosphate dehydrogenase, partial [Terriglobia bacterium]